MEKWRRMKTRRKERGEEKEEKEKKKDRKEKGTGNFVHAYLLFLKKV